MRDQEIKIDGVLAVMDPHRQREINQEAFNKAVIGVFKQGGASMNERKVCAYRGPDGRKCAIGHLLADDQYDKRFEGQGIGEYRLFGSIARSGYASVSVDLLVALQKAHDSSARIAKTDDAEFLELFASDIISIADEFDLIVPEIV